MRIDGDALRNGIHTDGTLTVEISGLGSPVAGVPETFEWRADRPVALVIIRSGIDGEDVGFEVGPSRSGTGRGVERRRRHGHPLRRVLLRRHAGAGRGRGSPCFGGARGTPAAPSVRGFGPTRRERRSILGLLLQGGGRRTAGGSLA